MPSSSEPTQAQAVYAIHNRLFFRLFQVGNTLDRQASNVMGISTVQWAVLGALTRPQAEQGMTFSELAEYLIVSRQSLDGVLKSLERDAHVERVTDPHDRRARRVVLTAHGRHFWRQLQPRIQAFYAAVMQDIRFDDKVAMVHLLNVVNQGLATVHEVELPAAPTVAAKKKAGRRPAR